MKIYQLYSNSDDFKWLETDADTAEYKFNGEAISDKWKRWNVWDSSKKRKIGDSPSIFIGVQVINQRAFEALNDLIQNEVEYLPINHKSKSYFLVNVLNVIDAVDMEKSEPVYANEEIIIHFKKIVFIKEKIQNRNIFKIPQLVRTRIYVSALFKETVEEANLKGFTFKEVSSIDMT